MARDHARIYTSIWDDPDFLALGESEQLTYLKLVSSPDVTWCGVLPLLPQRPGRLASRVGCEAPRGAAGCEPAPRLGTSAPPDSTRRFGVSHPNDPSTPVHPVAKTVVRRAFDADHGPVWRITYPCGCPRRQFRQYAVALIFATSHRCPEPWAEIPATRRRERH